jgi:hypothetical protein
MGGRTGPRSPGTGRGEPLPQLRLRERFGALRNVPPFVRMVWQTSRPLTLATLVLRLIRALLPVATLFVGKLIIDEVLRLAQLPAPPASLGNWLDAACWAGSAGCSPSSSPSPWGRTCSAASSRYSTRCCPNSSPTPPASG